jgi:chaperonin GroEL
MKQTISKDHAPLLEGVNMLADAVASTMGAHANTVSVCMPGGGKSLNDGKRVIEMLAPAKPEHAVMIARDPMAAEGMARVRRAAEATHRETGDGTSSTTIIFRALYQGGLDYLAANPTAKRSDVAQGVLRVANRLCAYLKAAAVRVDDGSDRSREALRSVANIAMHGHEWAYGIADLLADLGPEGSWSIEGSKSDRFETEQIQGFRWGAGAWNSDFMRNRARPEVIESRLQFGECLVVVIAGEINDPAQIEGVLDCYNQNYAGGDTRPLIFVFQSLVGSALATLSRPVAEIRNTRVTMPYYVLRCPQGHSYAQLEDFAQAVGTQVLDTTRGRSPKERMKISEFGVAKQMVIMDDKASVVMTDENQAAVNAYAKTLEAQAAEASDGEVETALRQRIAKLLGKFGIIRIAVSTESEYEFMKEMVDDCYRAVSSALREGVLPGCGASFLHAVYDLECDSEGGDGLSEAGWKIVPQAVYVISNRLCPDPGKIAHDIMYEENGGSQTYNAWTGEYGDAFELGVLDNAGSVVSALKNAAKEVSLLLNTEFFVINEPGSN